MRAALLLVCLLACEPSRGDAPGSSAPAAPASFAIATSTPTVEAAPVEAPPVVHEARELFWRYPETPLGPMAVTVSVPAGAGPMPVLIALHGWAEAEKAPERGARGWI